MASFVQRQPLVAALAAASVLLVVIIGLETGFGARLRPTVPAGVSRPVVPAEMKLLPSLAASDAETLYPETTARPLFVPLRRPAPPAEAAAASTLKRGQFVLQGVTIAGETRIALLREKSTGHVHRVEKGREVNGMKLAEVSPESVTLTQGNEQEVLPLQVLKPTASGGTIQGPFGPSAGSAPGAPAGAPQPPAGVQPPIPGIPGNAPRADFGPSPANPAARPPEGAATTAPMSPEELLARRRARRAQQNQ